MLFLNDGENSLPVFTSSRSVRFTLKSEIWAFWDVTTDKSQIVIISRWSEICSGVTSKLRFFNLKIEKTPVNSGCQGIVYMNAPSWKSCMVTPWMWACNFWPSMSWKLGNTPLERTCSKHSSDVLLSFQLIDGQKLQAHKNVVQNGVVVLYFESEVVVFMNATLERAAWPPKLSRCLNMLCRYFALSRHTDGHINRLRASHPTSQLEWPEFRE